MRPEVLLTTVVILTAAAPASGAGSPGFRSPSGNIVCIQNEVAVDCELRSTTNGRPPRPSSCRFDYGYRYRIYPGLPRGRRLCTSDALDGTGLRVLAYGRSWTRAGITCDSRRSGVTCRNRQGHGFFLSKARQRVF